MGGEKTKRGRCKWKCEERGVQKRKIDELGEGGERDGREEGEMGNKKGVG
jgi:hypothetical protein